MSTSKKQSIKYKREISGKGYESFMLAFRDGEITPSDYISIKGDKRVYEFFGDDGFKLRSWICGKGIDICITKEIMGEKEWKVSLEKTILKNE